MFEGFREETLSGEGAEIFLRRTEIADGPAIVLLHGYPQTSAMWRDVAPILARDWQVVCPDLRGYGMSSKPPSDKMHTPYSKRAMAKDIVAIMEKLGHQQFFVVGHDRGARVAHRLGLDHPDKIHAMSLLDIAPTREMYRNISDEFARAYWHWFFLIQDYPLPESLIEKNSEDFWKLQCNRLIGESRPFSKEAEEEYIKAFANSDTVHASCEDYRAAATIDIRHDDDDLGRKLSMPVQVLWAARGVIARCFDPIELWLMRAERVEGHAVPGTHFFAEERPAEVAELVHAFLSTHLP